METTCFIIGFVMVLFLISCVSAVIGYEWKEYLRRKEREAYKTKGKDEICRRFGTS